MRTVRTGLMAYDPSIAGAASRCTPPEASLEEAAPKAYAYAGGRMLFDRALVKVSRICMRERRFRYAKITFNYDV